MFLRLLFAVLFFCRFFGIIQLIKLAFTALCGKENPMISMHLPPQVELILDKLKSNGFDSFVVGGAVRSALMDLEPDDYDITTSAKPEQIKSIFINTVDIGITHGTVGVIIDHKLYEVTTFRIESDYKDKRRPDSVVFVDDLLKDLSRRDFTINAMAYSHSTGVIDPFGGTSDIKECIIRTVGDPLMRFGEDALRMLRAVRFCAKLGFELEPNTYDAIKKCSELICKISSERIRIELEKILLSDGFHHIRTLKDTGLLEYFMAPLSRCFDTPQKNIRHTKDVSTVASVPKEPVLRWAALLHDIGKPDTLSIADDGEHLFYAHALRSADLARDILNSLMFSNDQKHDILALIKHHDSKIQPMPAAVKRIVRIVGRDLFLKLLVLKRGDVYAQNPDMIKMRLAYIDNIEKIYKHIQDTKQAITLDDLQIDGRDLIAIGYSPNKQLGEVLEALLLAVIEKPELNEREVLLLLAAELKDFIELT